MQEALIDRTVCEEPELLPRVLLVSVNPIARRTLEGNLAGRAELRVVSHGTPAYQEAARAFAPHVVVVDATYIGSTGVAHAVAARFTRDGALLLFLGYANDRGEEASVSSEMGGVFNPSLEETLAAVQSAGEFARAQAAGGAWGAPPSPSPPGNPAGGDAIRHGDQLRGKEGS